MALSFRRALLASALLALVQAQGVVISAKGDSGTSLGLQVDPNNDADANFISQAEIEANVVNECGRTLANGNIDIGENTEDALAAGNVTQVTKGSDVTVTISQRNANGTGPFSCDLDESSNADGNSGQTALTVTQDDSGSATGDLTLKVTMPSDLACIGASTGNICTVRCKNAANFGGCFAVQQTDIAAHNNTPENIVTEQTLENVLQQVQQNQKDLPAAVAGIQAATTTDEQGEKVAEAILADDPVAEVAGTVAATASATASAAATSTAATTSGKNGKKKHNNNNKNNNNNRRDVSTGLRWARRYVIPGADYSDDSD
ncbi:Gas1-like protein [Pleurostoma richardsiae]|uniref:Gas1-like protein n=1 Tax=Pleurostoma richardsiae TaxID=41990 RepID=A0AA38VJX3_9PEZI|nr:Gas1-like protein [Pleurostoma richardsiae]